MAVESVSKVVGFASQYYTLWNVSENKQYSNINGKYYHVGTNFVYTYMKNLSKDENEALKKVSKQYSLNIDSIMVDEGLRGVTTRSFEKYIKILMPYTVFCVGRIKWLEISQSEDIWQLVQVYSGERAIGGYDEHNTSIPLRRKVLARRRLIELGELIRFDHTVKQWDDNFEQEVEVSKKYISKWDYSQMKKAENSYYLHTDKERVELCIKEVKRTGYDTAYGFMSIVTFENEIGENYIYKGSNPPNLEEESFTKVKATIKHEEYKGIKQTLIQRVKI